MKVKDLLEYIIELKEPAFSEKTMVRWINQIEAEIQTEVLLLAAEGIIQYTEDSNEELIAPPPFDKLYEDYLIWRIALAQEEAERANNAQIIFQESYLAYVRFVCETIDPGSGQAEVQRYYLTAYQIAVKYGYAGTEQKWIESLKGEPGEPGAGLNILGHVETEEKLPENMLTQGAGYLVGIGPDALLYIWDGKQWVYKQPLRGPKGEEGPMGPQGTTGPQGEQGERGEPGYTPVRGVDYWTQADKAAVVAETLAALPAYNGEVV